LLKAKTNKDETEYVVNTHTHTHHTYTTNIVLGLKNAHTVIHEDGVKVRATDGSTLTGKQLHTVEGVLIDSHTEKTVPTVHKHALELLLAFLRDWISGESIAECGGVQIVQQRLDLQTCDRCGCAGVRYVWLGFGLGVGS
jgi:hypothetical protein